MPDGTLASIFSRNTKFLDPRPLRGGLKIIRHKMTAFGSGAAARELQKKGVKTLRKWQREIYDALLKTWYGIVIAPTGSGKTLLLQALALTYAALGHKVLIATSQNAIVKGFERGEEIALNGKKRLGVWGVKRNENVKKLREFLLAPATANLSDRIMITTHAALAALRNQPGWEGLWQGTCLFVDEAHHVLCKEGSSSDLANRLGEIIRLYLTHKPGRLIMVTATWLRTQDTILEPEQLSKFKVCPYPFYEYIRAMWEKLEVQFSFVFGDQLEAVESLLRTDPERIKIIGFPRGYEREQTDELLENVLALTRSLGLECVDLVTQDSGRKQRLDKLTKEIETGRCTAKVLLLLGMCREGFDWPDASHAIMLEPSGSVLDTIQFFGRITRHVTGKNSIRMDVIFPTVEGKVTEDNLIKYFTSLFLNMLPQWQMMKAGSGSPADPTGDVPLMTKLAETLVRQRALRGSLSDDDIKGIVKGIFPTDAVNEVSEFTRLFNKISVMVSEGEQAPEESRMVIQSLMTGQDLVLESMGYDLETLAKTLELSNDSVVEGCLASSREPLTSTQISRLLVARGLQSFLPQKVQSTLTQLRAQDRVKKVGAIGHLTLWKATGRNTKKSLTTRRDSAQLSKVLYDIWLNHDEQFFEAWQLAEYLQRPVRGMSALLESLRKSGNIVKVENLWKVVDHRVL